MSKFAQWRSSATCTLLALGAAACVSGQPAQPLSAVNVPAGATLEMSRPVALAVTTTEAVLPLGAVAQVEVQREDGAILFEGPMVANQGLTSQLAVATNQSHVKVILHVPGKADATLDVAVASNAAAASFQ